MRDIVQNHGRQLLSMFAMEPPVEFRATDLRDEKLKVLRGVKPMSPEEVVDQTVRGQYVSGWVEGQKVASYRDEPEVAPDSEMETYAALRLGIDSWRWAGVPAIPELNQSRRTEPRFRYAGRAPPPREAGSVPPRDGGAHGPRLAHRAARSPGRHQPAEETPLMTTSSTATGTAACTCGRRRFRWPRAPSRAAAPPPGVRRGDGGRCRIPLVRSRRGRLRLRRGPSDRHGHRDGRHRRHLPPPAARKGPALLRGRRSPTWGRWRGSARR